MKTLLSLIVIFFSFTSHAQITKVSLQASGLTCSMCSNSINKALKTIDFVESIHPDIKTSTFDISFKEGSKVDFDKLKKKVEDAGFSVSNFVATIQFNNVQLKSNQPVSVGDKTFQFVNVRDQSLNGIKLVRVVDKGFISAKEYKKYAFAGTSDSKGIYHATI